MTHSKANGAFRLMQLTSKTNYKRSPIRLTHRGKVKHLLNCLSSPTLAAGRAGDLWRGKNHSVPALLPVFFFAKGAV